jgi:hypothetical protein
VSREFLACANAQEKWPSYHIVEIEYICMREPSMARKKEIVDRGNIKGGSAY